MKGQVHDLAAGLNIAVDLLKNIADKHDGVSYADLFQMASAEAIEVCQQTHNALFLTRFDEIHCLCPQKSLVILQKKLNSHEQQQL